MRLKDTGADGFVPAATIGNDYYRHDEDAHALVGDRTGETYRLGDDVQRAAGGGHPDRPARCASRCCRRASAAASQAPHAGGAGSQAKARLAAPPLSVRRSRPIAAAIDAARG